MSELDLLTISLYTLKNRAGDMFSYSKALKKYGEIIMSDLPFEIERKFLIEYPDEKFISEAQDISDIVQTYLVPEEKGVTDRVRKRTGNGHSVYTHTRKIRVNDMRRIEYEDEVDEEKYNALLQRADKDRNVILKKRICYYYKEQMFEIDLFSFWKDRAVMEIEIDNENAEVEFPPSIKIIKEITEDRRYTNAAMARQIPQEEI